MSEQRPDVFDVDLHVTVRLTIADPTAISRAVENVDGWQQQFYDFRTRDQVLSHLAWHVGCRGLQARELDGWADLHSEDVRAEVLDTTIHDARWQD